MVFVARRDAAEVVADAAADVQDRVRHAVIHRSCLWSRFLLLSFSFHDGPVRSVVGVARRVYVNLRLDCVWEGRPKAWCLFRCLFPYGSPRFTDCTIWQLHFRCVIWCFPPSNKRKRQVELNSGGVGRFCGVGYSHLLTRNATIQCR